MVYFNKYFLVYLWYIAFLYVRSKTQNATSVSAYFSFHIILLPHTSLFLAGKTQIRNGPVDNQVTFGESALFKCGAITDPQEINKLHYKWFKNGVEISTSDPRVRTIFMSPDFIFLTFIYNLLNSFFWLLCNISSSKLKLIQCISLDYVLKKIFYLEKRIYKWRLLLYA